MSTAPWFGAGLKFSCTQCGNCCTGEPGFTWLTEVEVATLATRLGLSQESFLRRYTRTVQRAGARRVSLVDKPNHECVFYKQGVGCTVYEDRPRQCRTWPFWRSNLASPESWSGAAATCPGMDHGSHHAVDAIAAIAGDDGLPG